MRMVTNHQLPHTASFNHLFRSAILDGLKLSLIVIPGGLLHQFCQHIKLSQSLSTSAHTTASAPTTTIFWNRRLFSLLSIIPGGIGIGVGAGLSTAYLHSLQSCSPNQPSLIADPEQQKP
ncbi:hypothetical protein PGT21_021574 [Puccinia graminis f. sp. tritici]|uniref:Uncharacterized protein n=1 Tax=Puccinia graminis f. sp. tritici TaxID=56615 RepID=A0A5B0Q3E4_PUCGR|nr:hypothetical protein PGT21_021574 [Puccinia graminis f. sp. tritici]